MGGRCFTGFYRDFCHMGGHMGGRQRASAYLIGDLIGGLIGHPEFALFEAR